MFYVDFKQLLVQETALIKNIGVATSQSVANTAINPYLGEYCGQYLSGKLIKSVPSDVRF